MIIAILVILGLALGSFVNALVWRLHELSLPKKKRKASDADLSIARGRSMCTSCRHSLSAKDLVPILSWLSTKGKCRYCKEPISWQYPAVELSGALLFVLSYLYWPYELFGWGWLAFGAWLISLTGMLALFVYDVRWMLLPNKIVFPLYGVGAVYVVGRCAADSSIEPLINAIGGLIAGGGIFYLLFKFSNGRWIGGGDVKLGFLIGVLVGSFQAGLLMLFIASVLATLLVVPLLASGKAGRGTKIPFGPFLIIAAFVVTLFGQSIIDWYVTYIVGV